MARLRELSETLLPLVASSGRLGEGVKFVECVADQSVSGQAQFASSVCFLTAVYQTDTRVFQQKMIVKYNMDDADVRNWLKLDFQFQNEVIVYEKVLPFLDMDGQVCEIFPKFFYGSAHSEGDPNKYVIILEDLRTTGYKLSPTVLDLDFRHCALAFKKLGAFHAWSFKAKKSHPEEFRSIVSELVETRLFEDTREDADYLHAGSVARAAKALLEKEEYIYEIQQFQGKLKDSIEYLSELLTVQEPMGVVCHGDFCRNNVLYKYDDDEGVPVDIKFFDLATARYGSPMLDFTFFLFLNSSEESRRLNTEKYLNIYYESLVSNCKGLNLPSLKDFKEEFRRKAVYGFLICAFFKPAMMDPTPFQPTVEVHKTIQERAETVFKKGGEKGTELICNMLRELLENKCEL